MVKNDFINKENKECEKHTDWLCMQQLADIADMMYLNYKDMNNKSYLFVLDHVINARLELKSIINNDFED